MINNFSPSLVFDIDGVCGYRTDDFLVTKYIYLKGKLVETPKGFHLVFPGVSELFQVLAKQSIAFDFYSFGTKERNEAFKDNIFKQIGFDEETANKVKVISADKFESLTLPEQMEIYRQFGQQPSRVVKNLEFTLAEKQEIKDKLIVEDTWGNVPLSQIPHLLHIKKTTSATFVKLGKKENLYSTGFANLKIKLFLIDDNLQIEIGRVERAKEILIYPSGHTYKIAYLRLDHLALVDEEIEDRALLSEIDQYCQNALHQLCEMPLSDQLQDVIYQYVEERGGKTTKVCRQANQIFYATGLIFTAIEEAKKRNKSLSETLFEMQYRPVDAPSSSSNYEFGVYDDPLLKNPEDEDHNTIVKKGLRYKNICYKLRADDSLYLKGLEILKAVNANLTLNTPYEYQLCLDREIKTEEVQKINATLVRKKVITIKY